MKNAYAFIAWEVSDDDAELLQSLTTKLMRWEDGVWLGDLRPFLSYWQRLAHQRPYDLLSLWRRILFQRGGEESHNKIIALPTNMRAVLASDPWQALFVLQWLRNQKLQGFVLADSVYGSHLYAQGTWDTFGPLAHKVVEHGRALNMREFKKDGFAGEWARWKRAMDRLGATTPKAVAHLTPESVTRRFGVRLGALWRWYLKRFEDDGLFPWRDWVFPPQIFCQRHLEHRLERWEEAAPFLKEDFEKLARETNAQRVCELAWDIVRDDMSTVRIPITFRHPHALGGEAGTQTTALLQAQYQFQAYAQKQREEKESWQPYPHMVSWKLSVVKALTLPPFMQDLFGGEEGSLQQLENELPISLKRFDWAEDWQPEGAFREYEGRFLPEEEVAAYRSASAHRPLFLYRDPWVLDDAPQVMKFSEKVMDKWWATPATALERVYYRLQDSAGQNLWAYRDQRGKWHVHGLFN